MKRLWLLLPLLASPCVAAEAPFAPVEGVPDYVATFDVKPGSGPPRTIVDTVRRHGAWVRTDRIIDGRKDAVSYFGPGPVSITIRRDPMDALRSLLIMRSAEKHRSVGWDHAALKTEDRETFLGESCDVWNVARMLIDGPGTSKRELKRLSCIAGDGVELWNRFVEPHGESSSVRATGVERRPVPPGDVLPPANLLDLQIWFPKSDTAQPRPARAPSDVTVTMQTERSAPNGRPLLTRTFRRHFPWTFTEEIHGDGKRTLFIEHEARRANLQFESDAAGQPVQLSMTKTSPTAIRINFAGEPKPINPGRTDVIAGEHCTWFDMWPNIADAGLHQCRTNDGIVLREHRMSRMHYEPLIAVQVERAPIDPVKVMPPQDILRRAAWGIPE